MLEMENHISKNQILKIVKMISFLGFKSIVNPNKILFLLKEKLAELFY